MTSSKEYYEQHPEKKVEHHRNDYLWHKDERRAHMHEYYLENSSERISYQQGRWKIPAVHVRHNLLRRLRYAIDPSRRRTQERIRDAELRGAGKGLTLEDWNAILLRFGFKCAYCGILTARLTIDHVIPISKGGSNSRENIVPACQSCNSKKGTHIVPLPEPHVLPALRIP